MSILKRSQIYEPPSGTGEAPPITPSEPTPTAGDAWNITSQSEPYISASSSDESYEGFDVSGGQSWTVTPPT
jgi:hypothetical protein